MLFLSDKLLMIIKLLWIYFLLITDIACYAQNVNTVTTQQLNTRSINLTYTVRDNENTIANNSIQQVDSIAHSSEMARHFCQVYSKTLKNIASQMQDMDSGAKVFINKFEIGFVDSFLNARVNDKNGNLSPESEWKCFFSNPTAQPWQLVLLGVNAHTNVNIWQALVNNFSEREIRQYKKQYLALKYSVAKVYYQFFDTLMSHNSYLRFINSLTLGLAKKIGERIMFKWRRRNVNLAIMYYQDQEKFKRRLAIVNRKKQKNDQRILRYKS